MGTRSLRWIALVRTVPNILKYAYVWCLEIDTTYKGNLTRWFEESHASEPKADFITFNAITPKDWMWATDAHAYNTSREPRALYLDVPAEQRGHASRWKTGYEHIRLWYLRPHA